MRTLIWALLAGAGLAAGAPEREEVCATLVWRTGARESDAARALPLGARPEGVTAPERGTSVRYARLPLGARQLLLAVDLTRGAARIWIDEDFDGEIADEGSIVLEEDGERIETTVDLFLPLQAGAPPRRIPARFFRGPGQGAGELSLVLQAHLEGSVVLAGRLRRLELYDRRGGLGFDDADEDRLYLDLDGDGSIEPGEDSFERIRPGETFRLRDQAYSVRIDGRPARVVCFSRADGATPPLRRRWRPAATPPPSAVEAPPADAAAGSLEACVRRYGKLAARATAHATADERVAAVARAGAEGTKEAFQFLYRVFRTDRDVRVRAAAVKAMGYADYVPFATRVFAIATRAKPAEVRLAAIAALHGMDAPRRARVLEQILSRDAQDEVCAAAARHLAYLGSEDAFAILREAVEKLPRPASREAAYFAATRCRAGEPPAELILAAARRRDPRLSARALRDAFALQLPGARAVALERSRDREAGVELQLAVTDLLGAAGDAEAVEALLALAEVAPPEVLERIVARLQPVRDGAAIDALIGGLASKSGAARATAADVLAEVPGPRVAAALAARLAVERKEVAVIALIRAAGRHRAAAAAPAILDAAARKPKVGALQEAALEALGRIGLAHKPVAEFFDKRARARDWTWVVAVLDAAALDDDAAAVRLLIRSLDHAVWHVRLVAVEGLGRVRAKQAIPPLIARLDEEERVRIRKAILETLFRITGESLSDDAGPWQRWWRERGPGFTVPAEVPRRRRPPQRGGSTTTFYGVPVESNRVVFVIDQSGSMASGAETGKNDLERAVDETLRVVGKLNGKAEVNVVLFETSVHPWRKRLVPLDTRARASLERHLRTQRPTGGTNLYDALEAALLSEGADTIYLLSDGVPEAGKYTRPEEILREVAVINRSRRIAIHCIALGYDSPLLEQLAAQNDGRYVRR